MGQPLAVSYIKNGIVDLSARTFGCDKFLTREQLRSVVEDLKKHMGFNTLRLAGQRFGDEGLKELFPLLTDNRCIEVIDLSDTGITERGCAELAELLKSDHAVKELILNKNALGNAGASALKAALFSNRTLVYLSISHCGISRETAHGFKEIFSANDTKRQISYSSGMDALGLLLGLVLAGNLSVGGEAPHFFLWGTVTNQKGKKA